jgi:hypothetical protein
MVAPASSPYVITMSAIARRSSSATSPRERGHNETIHSAASPSK